MNNEPSSTSPEFIAGIPGYTFADLFDPHRLSDLTDLFHDRLAAADPPLFARFQAYRESLGVGMKPEDISAVLVETAPHLATMIAEIFGDSQRQADMQKAVEEHLVVFTFKREFVVRRALKRHPTTESIDAPRVRMGYTALQRTVFSDIYAATDPERATAIVVTDLAALEKALRSADSGSAEMIARGEELSKRIAEISTDDPELREALAEIPSECPTADIIAYILSLYEGWVALEHNKGTLGWPSLSTPHTLDYAHLVETRIAMASGMPAGSLQGPEDTMRYRDGFGLTDERFAQRKVMDEVEYCIYCHNRDKDSCSKGFHDKDGSRRRNPLGVPLGGCPLDEKISEAHLMKHHGDGIAALALIMIDNPMCPGTGHRICNDCMKACIYQKQEPVNIPQIETSLLTEVLDYPWGFEIYSLLTRWNPLHVRRQHALPYNGKKILVVGLGPAGYTLANYLVNEGFGVVGIDGLKIEPLPEKWIGNATTPPEPIYDWRSQIYDKLDKRMLLGFGGVSEYGITVRWDKNFLKVIYITLARRRTFKFYGGVRFGGTITVEGAWKMGFDHIAIATGAGRPTIVPMKGNLMRGIRQASDFLMALQLTGAYKPGALANLQVRLPAIVIGGGLTGIDTATELMAYYPVQVERLLERYETLVAEHGDNGVRSGMSSEEIEILDEFLKHGRSVRSERQDAADQGRVPNFVRLIRLWGGVSLVYRKSMIDSPAYRLNHEEIAKALEEGIYFVENLSPVEAVADIHGAVSQMVMERFEIGEEGRWRSTGETVCMPARSVMVAAGTAPNTIIERETPGAFEYDDRRNFFAQFVETTSSTQQPSASCTQ